MMYRGSLVTGKEPWIKQLDPAFEYEEKDGDYPGWRLMSDQTALALVEIVKKLIDKSPELLRLVQTCKERGFEFDVVKDEFRDEIILPMDSIPIQEMHITPKIGRMFW